MIRRPVPMPALLRRLSADREGATLLEFAFVAPILIMMIMGVFDMAHTQYTNSMLNGAMQKAGRDLTLESAGSQQAAIDAEVRSQVVVVVPPGAQVTFEKQSHFDFADIGEPEPVLGDNGNNRCDPGERYVDTNESGSWEADRGKSGIGGARDAVLYTAVVTYPRMFPMYTLAGLPRDVTLRASTVLRNQPFDEQDRSTTQRDC
jgi:Flp pilus assembly pilin Flp